MLIEPMVITTPRHALMMLGLQQLRLRLPRVSLAETLPEEIQQRLQSDDFVLKIRENQK